MAGYFLPSCPVTVSGAEYSAPAKSLRTVPSSIPSALPMRRRLQPFERKSATRALRCSTVRCERFRARTCPRPRPPCHGSCPYQLVANFHQLRHGQSLAPPAAPWPAPALVPPAPAQSPRPPSAPSRVPSSHRLHVVSSTLARTYQPPQPGPCPEQDSHHEQDSTCLDKRRRMECVQLIHNALLGIHLGGRPHPSRL